LSAGNDVAARDFCPCIWITAPTETEKILEHVLNYKLGQEKSTIAQCVASSSIIHHHQSTNGESSGVYAKKRGFSLKTAVNCLNPPEEVGSNNNEDTETAPIDLHPFKLKKILTSSPHSTKAEFNVYLG
jgi:hypothetical protein